MRVFIAFDRMDKDGVKANLSVLEELAVADESVTIDMSRVVNIDGAGIGAMAHLHRGLCSKGHELIVINASPRVSAMLQVLGISGMLGLASAA